MNIPSKIVEQAVEEFSSLPSIGKRSALRFVLHLLKQDPEYFLQNSTVSEGLDEAAIQALIDERTQARKDKNFARSDEVRDELAAQGIELLDSREGTSWTRR